MNAINKQVVVQQVRFAKGDVRPVKFTATEKRVTVRCKGFPVMVVRPNTEFGDFEATVTKSWTNRKGLTAYKKITVNAKTPKRAYRLAVREGWGILTAAETKRLTA